MVDDDAALGLQAVDHQVIPGANHFFEGKNDELIALVEGYLDKRLDEDGTAA